jgi:hypothetical protein
MVVFSSLAVGQTGLTCHHYFTLSVGLIGIFGPLMLNFETFHPDLEAIHCLNCHSG